MFKRLFAAIVLIAFLAPHQQVFAEEKNIYYNAAYQYSITFPNEWYIFSDEMKKQISPEETINSPAMFTRKDGLTQLFIRHLPSTDVKYKLYKNIIQYVQEAPKDKQKIQKKLNPVSTELGRSISGYNIDDLNETVELQLKQSSPQFGEIYTTIFWKEFRGTLIELEFYRFDNSDGLLKEVKSINNSFTISAETLNTNLKEGSISFLNNKMVSHLDTDNSFFDKAITIIEKPVVWISALSAIALLILIRLIYKLI